MQEDTLEDEFKEKVHAVLAPIDAMNFEKRLVSKTVQDLVRRGSLTVGAGLGLVEALVEGILTDPRLIEKRDKAADAKKEDKDAGARVAEIAAARKALQDAGGSPDIAMETDEILSATLKDLTEQSAKLTAQDYDKAVEILVQRMSEFAVKFHSRQGRQLAPTARRRGMKVGARQ
jgi:hypothetical protein